MPLIDSNDVNVWNSLYDIGITGNQRYHYERAAMNHLISVRSAQNLADALIPKGLLLSSRIALIGGGYGWMQEHLNTLGYTNVSTIDTSSYIHTNKGANAVVPVLDEDVSTAQGRTSIKNSLGGTVDWVISEDILPILSDAEALQLAKVMRQLGSNVAHWISYQPFVEKRDARLNWHTMQEWKDIVTPDWCVQRGGSVAI